MTMSPIKTPPITHRLAQNLRHNSTETESKLWAYLRSHRFKNIHFRRQHTIGNYIVDFCAPRKKLIIELDGSQHQNHEEQDNERTSFLISKGYKVLRFWNNDISNHLEEVMVAIELAINNTQED